MWPTLSGQHQNKEFLDSEGFRDYYLDSHFNRNDNIRKPAAGSEEFFWINLTIKKHLNDN